MNVQRIFCMGVYTCDCGRFFIMYLFIVYDIFLHCLNFLSMDIYSFSFSLSVHSAPCCILRCDFLRTCIRESGVDP